MAYRNNLDATSWVTAQGECLRPVEMTNSHLINTILYLERNAAAIKTQTDLELADNMRDNVLSITGLEDSKPIKEEFAKVWRQDPLEWISKTNIYQALMTEIHEREVEDLLEIIRSRNEVYVKEVKLMAEEPKLNRIASSKIARHPSEVQF